MPLFPTNTVSGLTDRIAAIVQGVDNTLILARAATGVGDLFRRVSSTGIYEVERDLITPTHDFEAVLSGVTVLAGNAQCSALVTAMNTHCQKTASVTFNTYLTNSGLQVSEYYAQLHGTVLGTQLSAHNVFAERRIIVATTFKVGAGNWTFTAGQALGSGGTSSYESTTPNTGEQLLMAALPSGVSTTECRMNVSGLNDAGSVVQATFTFPNNIDNAHAYVSETKKFRSVTNIAVVTDTSISDSSTVIFHNVRERIISY